MQKHKFNTRTETKPSLTRQVVERQKDEHEAKGARLPQRDPFEPLISGIGDASSAGVHASMLNRATDRQPSRAGQSLLRLQRQYGNRYVQKVLALAGKGTGEAEATPKLEQSIQQARGGGQALDSKVRGQMEPTFGADFSGVRIHADTQADTLNRELNARAFTTGQDIFFRQDAYNPGNSSSRELIAHELTHVVQQNGDKVQRKLTVGQPGDKYGQEADQVARAVMQQEQQVVQKQSDGKLVCRQVEEEEEELQMKSEAAGIHHQVDEGDERESVQTKRVDTRIQRQMEEEGKEEEKEKVEEVTFTDEMTEEKVLTVEEEMEYYLDALVTFFQNTAHNYNVACGCFRSTMFEKKAGASADILGTVLNEGMQIVINKLVESTGKYVPGLGDAVITISTAISKEIEVALKAAKANKLVDFINNAAKKVMDYLTHYSQKISSHKDVYMNSLMKEAGSPDDVRYVLFGLELEKIRKNRLDKLTTINEIERSLYEGWMRHSQRGGSGGLIGATEMKQGILLLHYQIDENEESAELDRMVLVGPYAEQVKMGLMSTATDNKIDTKTLHFTRLVQVEKDRQHRWPIIVAHGKIPRDDPMHYFSKLIKELPIIDLRKVTTTEEKIPIWP